MNNKTLSIAFWNYDRTQALVDGTVKIEGADATFHTARILPEIFERMIRGREFDVAELGLTYLLRAMEAEEPSPFLAIPVFVNRAFRHSAIYANKASGITRPQDLAGKTIGELALYGHDAGVWPKGILSDEFGVTPAQSRWIVGGIDFPMKSVDFVAHPQPADVDVTWAPEGTDLGEMLDRGEIDALISADVPRCVLEKSPRVGRLFEDFVATERDYYTRTGLFPIMHTVVVRRELAIAQPELVRAVYKGFCDAKDAAQRQYVQGMTFNNMATMVPWISQLLDADRSVLGADWWPYGMRANRKALDTYLRYHFEQGLSKRLMTCEDLFVPCLMES